ncbi:RNA methyltransferase [gamma proteobacterium HdN1]|nr:RNA methyltransferase [gamma proteobacterium HdN1]
MNDLDRISIVMVHTTDSGNLGSAARAMKTMGIHDLRLVAPEDSPDTAKAIARASGAADLLLAARQFDTLEEALADCSLVFGASARKRTIPWPLITPPVMADLVLKEPVEGRVAVLFGREDNGLTNEELSLCHYHVTIPCSDEYCVLNVSQAIQVICYQLRQSLVERPKGEEAALDTGSFGLREWDAPPATGEEMERFFRHLEETLVALEFLKHENPGQLMTRMRRMFGRIRPDHMEVNVLRGVLTAMQKKLRGQ